MNNTLRILLIDDNSDDRALVMRELQREFPDYEVEQIIEAQGLACAVEAGEFDLVITACRLGWTDGLEILRVIKAHWPECPVLMLACTDTEEIAVEAMNAGLDDYVLKSPQYFARVPVAVRLALGRVQQRQALKESETRYQSLFDRMPVGFYRTTPEGQVLDVNTALVRMLGYPDQESLLAINAADVYVNSHNRRRWQALMECEGAVRDFEVQWRRLDGTIIWVRDRAQVVCDANDQALYYEGVLEDITEHKQAEEMLERRISQLALLSDIGGKIAAVLELDSVLDRATRLVQENFGYHHVALFTVDSDQGVLAMGSRAGSYTYLFPSDHRLKLGQGMVGWVGRHGETLLANDVSAESRYVNLYPDVIPTQSELSVPIRVSEGVVGVIDIQSPRLNAFDENDVMVLETLADQIAVAIENARLYEVVQQELAERKQAEEALRGSEERLRAIFDAAGDAIFTKDVAGRYTHVNAACARMFGLPEQEIVEKTDFDLFPHDFATHIAEVDARVLKGEMVSDQDTKPLAGRMYTFHVAKTPLYGPNGEIIGLCGVTRDITELKLAEEKLRRLKEFNERIVQGVDEGLLIEDSAGIITFVNPALEALLGYSASELFGQPWQTIVLEGELVGGQAELPHPPAGAASRYETRLLAKDGTEIPVIVSARPLFEGDTFVGVLSALTDITQRKQVEEALRRERDFSQSIIETTPALIVVLDTDGRITLFNRACEELAGYAAAEVIGHTLWEFLVPEQFPEQFIHGVQEAFAKLQGDMLPGSYEIPLLTRDGNEHWITWTSTYIKDGADNVAAIVGVGIDVTELRHMQRALERRNRELRALVEAGQVLSGTLDLDEVLDSVLDAVQRQFDLASVSFSSYDPTTQTFEIRAQHYDDPAHQVGRIGDRRKRDQHPYSSRALDTGQLIYEPDLWSAPHIPEERRAEARALNIRSVVEVPLIARGQPVGVLHLRAFETPRFFTDEELAFVRAIAPAAAVAIYNAQLYRRLEQRVQEISTLHHAGQVLTGVIDVEQLLQFVVETAVAMLPGAERGTIQLYDEESGTLVTRAGVGYTEQELARIYLPLDRSVAGHCFATGKPWIVEDAAADPYFCDVDLPVARATHSMMAVPLLSKGRSIGVLCVDSLSSTRAFADDDMRVLSTLASQAAAAIEAARLFTQVDVARTRAEELAARVVQAQEDERRRIARELHDEVGQLLTGTKLSQEMLVADMPAEPAELRERALENVDLIDETMDVVRKLSLDLRPAALDELGLSAALEWHIERYQHQTGLQVTFRESLFPRQLLDPLATAVYRVVQEALTNIARHALATSVGVEVTCGEGKLSVQVTDDGCGFDVTTALRTGPAGGHFGLVGLQERATLLGGEACIESTPGQGTKITVEFPLPECE